MQIKTLYRYKRADGGITVTPDKPETDNFEVCNRLIADDGKMLTTDGENLSPCVDVDDVAGWYEVADPEAENTQGGDINEP
ncbi:MAG: hypothetical protein J6Q61_06510 [Bacteroidales bacterium]|nr:hypothetical protein [Bacteroidales bacterium]